MSHRPLLAASLLTGLLLAPVAGARAFSDADRYEMDAGTGGGGGRYFSGSPVDGFTCAVCHRGGSNPELRVLGLPIDGYAPGQSYDVQIAWEQAGGLHGLALEIIDRSGGDGVDLRLFEDGDLADAERCSSNSPEAGARASFITQVGARRILRLKDCGASIVRFRMTAPNVRDLAFSLSAVRSDASGTAEGDGVIELARLLYRSGDQPSGATGSCNAAVGSKQAPPRWGMALFALCSVALRRRRTRTSGAALG